MNLSVPSSAPGFKSLPAQLKVGAVHPMLRLRASSPGYAGMWRRNYRLAGLGDDTTTVDPITGNVVTVPDPTASLPTSEDISSMVDQLSTINIPLPGGYTGPTTVPMGTTPPTAPAGYQWAQVLNAANQSIGQVLAIAQGGSTTTLPNGLRIVQGSPQGAIASAGAGAAGMIAQAQPFSVGSMVMIGGLAVVLILAMQMGRR